MKKEILVEVKERVAWITVNRPEVRNALNRKITSELADRFRDLAREKSVRAIVLCGAGDRVFISGADISEFKEELASPGSALEYDANAEEMLSAIKAAPQPVIAMIQGYAIGSGCIVATACDFRIASKAARFGIPIAKFGFIVPVPDVLRLVEMVGPSNTKWILMTGQILSADRAFEIGLVNQVTEPERLVAETETLARTLAESSPISLKSSKQMIENHSSISRDVYRGAPWYQEIFSSRDFREGLEAYHAKRKPEFHGE